MIRLRPLIGAPLSFPRLDCLGLIEAGAVYVTVGSGTAFPRLDCLGLIEAPRWAVVTVRRGSCFRGLIASASLKPLELGAIRGRDVVSEA